MTAALAGLATAERIKMLRQVAVTTKCGAEAQFLIGEILRLAKGQE
jgi:hypothetical protein